MNRPLPHDGLGAIALSDLSCRLFIDAARSTRGPANPRRVNGYVQALLKQIDSEGEQPTFDLFAGQLPDLAYPRDDTDNDVRTDDGTDTDPDPEKEDTSKNT